MALQASGIADLVTTTQKKLNRFKWQDVSQRLNEYPMFEMLMNQDMVDFVDDGYEWQFNIKVVRGSPARMTGFFATDILNQQDTQKVASLPFRHMTHNYIFDEKEPAMNSGESRIVDELKVRRADCYVELAEKFEVQSFTSPASSATDDMNGIPYHVVKAASGTAVGFTGGHATGHSEWSGLSRTVYTGLKNMQGSYISVTKNDFVDKLVQCLDLCYFKPPKPYPSYSDRPRYRFFTTRGLRRTLITLLEQQNDNLGEDIDSMNGKLRIRQQPVDWLTILEADTDVPFYGVDTTSLRIKVMRPFYLREQGPTKLDKQHTTYAFYVDLSCNLICTNPRANFVLSLNNTGTAG